MQKIILSLFLILIILIIVFFLSKKYKLNKNQKIIFWILVLFWSGISIIRAYRKLYAQSSIEIGGLGLSLVLAAQITSAYGLISTFVRLPLFFLSDIFKQKKIFIQIALIFLTISSFLVYFKPSFNHLYISSIAMGFCASMLSMFNVLFSETFKKEQAAISASILSLAPLLAEFISAPIQYICTFENFKNFNMLWLFSSIISIITLILTFYMVEFSSKTSFSLEKVKIVIKNKNFLSICFIGILISFMKFATSGANIITYAKMNLNMSAIMLAYIDIVFSLSQLISSVLVGTYFVKIFSLNKILSFGIVMNIIFYLITIFTNNAIILFFSYILNGFGYGMSYISLISIALDSFDFDYRNISMGIFQGFFAIGIFFGDSIYILIYNFLNNKNIYFNQNKAIFFITILIGILNLIILKFEKIRK